MKVGTDSIVLGSWTNAGQAQQILDIGTGSGLLALMMAQKSSSNSLITGIDSNQKAIYQAKVNGLNSPWSQRLHFLQTSLQSYEPGQFFDLIISNPPYFQAKQVDPDLGFENISAERKQARHTSELTHSELLLNVARLLATNGTFYCVLPDLVCEAFVQEARLHGLFCHAQLSVSSKPGGVSIRRFLKFARRQQDTKTESLTIHADKGGYTQEYKDLCKDYYLNF